MLHLNKKQKNRLISWTISAVVATDLYTDDSFVEKRGSLKYQISDECQSYDECQVYRGSIQWTVATKENEWEEKETDCSVLEADDEKTAEYLHYISDKFGEAAVKVHTINGRFVVLQEITSCFSNWYSTIYNTYLGDRRRKDDWWKHIEPHVRELLRGVIKSFLELHPNYSHGNLMRGIAISNGQARLFNMKHPGIEGSKNDIACLHCMILNVVNRVPPEEFKRLDVDYQMPQGRLYCSTEFATFLKCLEQRKDKTVNIYTPFFWTQDQKVNFLRAIYDLFWKDLIGLKDVDHKKNILNLETCFDAPQWNWKKYIPKQGPFKEVFDFGMSHGGWNQKECFPKAYSIAFWRHSITHYNDYVPVGERRTVQEINIDLNERFGIVDRVFHAVCNFTERYNINYQDKAVYDRMVELRDMPAILDDPVQLIVLSKNKFCLLWDRRGTNMNKHCIYYSRFSISYDDLPDPTLDVEKTRSFLVGGCRVLDVVTEIVVECGPCCLSRPFGLTMNEEGHILERKKKATRGEKEKKGQLEIEKA
ncbi:hypothetical protein K1719_041299 [Acacia pycnantha]|nr:hypothetical protein K1719_041299 [Acacia pycnantha]